MSFAQQLIGRMRDILDASDQSQTPEFMDAATEYLELCRSTNERLRRCAHFLRQNLRTEAIHLAEADPNLLDLVAILDFPERQAWRKLCASLSVPEPPNLDIDAATELNEAYALVQPLETLLIRHRRLALAMAPLSERLAVMRKLAELDPGSSFWQQDIRTFEDARVDELWRQINQPGIELNTAERLKREIDTAQWLISFPPDLKKASDRVVSKLRGNTALRELELLMPELDAAYAAMDQERCQKLVVQCSTLLSEAGGASSELLQQRITAVQSWLQSQQRIHQEQQLFERVCNTLEQAMDAEAPTIEVQKAFAAATGFAAELPVDLEERYRKFIAWRKKQIADKKKLILAVSVSATAVLIIVVVAFMLIHIHTSTVNTWVQQLTAARDGVVNNGDEQTAQSELAGLLLASSGVQNDSGVQSAATSLKAAVAADEQRAANFKKALADAETLGVNAAGAARLSQAEQLALTAAEKQQLAAFSGQVNAYNKQQQQLRDNAFSQSAGALEQKIQYELSSDMINQNIQDAAQVLSDLKSQVAALAAQSGVSDDLKNAQIASLNAQLQDAQSKLAAQESDQKDYQQIFQVPSQVSDYATAVNNYLNNHPNGVYAAEVKLLATPLVSDAAIEAWSNMTAAWTGSFLTPDMAQAEDRVSAIDQFATPYQGTPLLTLVQSYRNYLASCAKAASDDGPWKQSFAQILNKPLLHDLQFLKTVDGKIYYVMPGSQVNQSSIGDTQEISFKAVTTSDFTQPTLEGMAASELVSTTPQDSPEAQFSHQALDLINAMQVNDYTLGLDLLAMLQKSSINPVVKGILVNDLVILNNTLLPSSVNDQFNPTVSLLQPLGLANINWLDPDNSPAQTTIDAVNDAVDKLPDISQIENTLDAQEHQMAVALGFRVHGLAIFKKTSQGVDLVTSVTPLEGMTLAAALPSDDQSVLTQIGTYTGGTWTFDPVLVNEVQTGTLVFIISNESGN